MTSVAKSQLGFLAYLERPFEKALWGSRLIVIVAVTASLAVALEMFYMATVDTVGHLAEIRQYATSVLTAQHETLRTETIAQVIEGLDGYLLGIVMLIFSFGLYELCISRIDPAEASDRSHRILVIHTLDDLKHRLGQVILLMLVVKFFGRALWVTPKTPLDLVYFAIAIVVIAGALYLTHHGNHTNATNHVPGLGSRDH